MSYPKEKIYSKEIGQGDNLLVFIHAFPVNSNLFKHVYEEMLPQGWRGIYPDLPGFGNTPEDSSKAYWTMEELAQLIANIIPEVNGKLILGGVSMGGYITMAYAKQFQDQADGYILSNTRDGADADGGKGRKEVVAKIQQGNRKDYLQNQLMPRALGKTSMDIRPEVVEQTQQLFESTTDLAIIQTMRGMGMREDSREFFKEIDKPILIICGDEDKITGPEISRPMYEAYQNARFEIIKESGHFSALEKPKEFAKVVYNFLENLS